MTLPPGQKPAPGPLLGPMDRGPTPEAPRRLHRQSSRKRVIDVLARVFGRRGPRRTSLFPSVSSAGGLKGARAALPAPARPIGHQAGGALPLLPLTPLTLPEAWPSDEVTEMIPQQPPLPDATPSDAQDLDDYDWLHDHFPCPPAPPRRHSGRAMPLRPDSLTVTPAMMLLAPPEPIETPPFHPHRVRPLRIGGKHPPTALNQQRYQGRTLPDLLDGLNRVDLPEEALPMATLQIALVYVLANEGTAFVDDPADHGGMTRYGVTLNTLSQYLGRTATEADVRNLSMQTVADIYGRYYWTPIKGQSIQSQAVATALLDIAVLCGPSAATRMLQSALGCTPDGVMGPKTLAAINQASPADALQGLSLKACSYFSAIALRDATQAKFLPGWQMRAHRMLLQKATQNA